MSPIVAVLRVILRGLLNEDKMSSIYFANTKWLTFLEVSLKYRCPPKKKLT